MYVSTPSQILITNQTGLEHFHAALYTARRRDLWLPLSLKVHKKPAVRMQHVLPDRWHSLWS